MTIEAVQDAALAEASAQAESLRSAARERADQALASARAEAAALVTARRAAAERLADLEERERLAQARAQARATVLSAQETALIEARSAVWAAGRRLVGDRRYELMLEQLVTRARQRLKDAGPVRIVPVAGEGFIARAGSRQIDYSLDALLYRYLEAMASELEGLWR